MNLEQIVESAVRGELEGRVIRYCNRRHHIRIASVTVRQVARTTAIVMAFTCRGLAPSGSVEIPLDRVHDADYLFQRARALLQRLLRSEASGDLKG